MITSRPSVTRSSLLDLKRPTLSSFLSAPTRIPPLRLRPAARINSPVERISAALERPAVTTTVASSATVARWFAPIPRSIEQKTRTTSGEVQLGPWVVRVDLLLGKLDRRHTHGVVVARNGDEHGHPCTLYEHDARLGSRHTEKLAEDTPGGHVDDHHPLSLEYCESPGQNGHAQGCRLEAVDGDDREPLGLRLRVDHGAQLAGHELDRSTWMAEPAAQPSRSHEPAASEPADTQLDWRTERVCDLVAPADLVRGDCKQGQDSEPESEAGDETRRAVHQEDLEGGVDDRACRRPDTLLPPMISSSDVVVGLDLRISEN